MSNTINQLIILGNGFDLACGLKSQYKDFFEYRYSNLGEKPFDKLKESIESGQTSSELLNTEDLFCEINAWDLIFTKYHKDDNDPKSWRDVESSIAQWVLHPRGKEQYSFDRIIEQDSTEAMEKGDFRCIYTVDDIEACHQAGPSRSIDRSGLFQWSKHMDIYDPLERLRALHNAEARLETFDQCYWGPDQLGYGPRKINGQWVKESYGNEFRDFLFSQLNLFERLFSDYLGTYPLSTNIHDEKSSLLNTYLTYYSSSIDRGNKFLYEHMANALFDGLTHANILQKSNISNYVLSFNYTHPISQTKAPSFRNIHGSIENETIFGIDSEDNLANNHISQFTKTVRVFNYQNDNTHDDITLNPLDQENNFSYIKFFGHGLAEADYSYFQSIFDRIHLYDSSTKIIFYYIDNYKPNYQTIIDLINRYAQRQPSESQRVNLLHKLILEDRLSIKDLNQSINIKDFFY